MDKSVFRVKDLFSTFSISFNSLIFGQYYLINLWFFLGPTHFESGEWCGVELDLPEGKNNGQISGTDYFHCLPNHGLFVPSHCVELLKDITKLSLESVLRKIVKTLMVIYHLSQRKTDCVVEIFR